MYLFYSQNIIEESILLSEEEHQHCTKVLRHQKGDTVQITDGKGHIFACRIMEINKSETRCFILSKTEVQKPTNELSIAISPTKNAARLEWFVEKAVEIGISNIYVFQAKRTEKKSSNLMRIHKIMVSAMKQSMNIHIPNLTFCENMSKLMEVSNNIDQKFIAHCEGPTESLTSQYKSSLPAIVLIGPEGDFTIDEIKNAIDHGFSPVSLGESRLRTETAGLVALLMMKLQ